MNERCIEVCSPKGDGEDFELDPKLKLHTMPAYPDTDDLKPKLQFKIEKSYTKIMFEFLQGKEELGKPIVMRPRIIYKANKNDNV